MLIIAIDPGTSCGYASGLAGEDPRVLETGGRDLWREARKGHAPRPAQFDRQGNEKRPADPGMPAINDGPRWTRAGRMFLLLDEIVLKVTRCEPNATSGGVCVVMEDSPEYIAPKMRKSTEILDNLRGVVMAWCALKAVPIFTVTPGDLKRFATGKGDAGKPLMVSAAREFLGYGGAHEDEADAWWLLAWARKFRPWSTADGAVPRVSL